jgi:autotransporter-associated beta strand protein
MNRRQASAAINPPPPVFSHIKSFSSNLRSPAKNNFAQLNSIEKLMKYKPVNRFLHTSHSFIGAGLAAISLSSLQAQTTGNWNYNGVDAASNSWNTAGSWTGLAGGLVPNSIGATPNFTFNITAARTITLDGDKTVGTLTINDPTSSYFGYTLSAGTPTTSQLIFDVASGSAAILSPATANTVANTISVPITFNDPLEISNTKTNVNGTLNLNGIVSDGAASLGITKLGNGIVQFGAANTYDGGTTITAGRLGAGNATSYGTGAVAVANGGQAWLSSGATYPNDFSLAGNGYANTADAGALNGSLRYGGATTTGTITVASSARIGGYNGASGTMAGSLSGAGALEINQSGTSHNGNLILTGNAAGFTGTVTVSQGTLRLGTTSNLGGSLDVKDGANLYVENIGTPGAATVGTDTGATRSLTLGNPGSTTTGATLFIDPSTNDALQVNGDVNLNGTTTVNLTGAITSNPVKVLAYSGNIAGTAANLTLPGGMTNYRPGTQFTVGSGQVLLGLVIGDVTWTGAVSSNWNNTENNWSDGSATTFYNLDNVTFDESAGGNAAFTTNLTAATNNDLVFTAVASGAAGEVVSIEYVDPFVADSPLSVTVNGSAITVSLATNSLSGITTVASEVKAAIAASGAASALVAVDNAAANDGSGLVAAMSAVSLAMTNPAITIPTGVTVAPGEMTFNHSTIDYSIAGPGLIGGGSLIKSGTGTLTITAANTFAGGATLNAGRLRVGSATALGAGNLTLAGGQLSSDSTTSRTLANSLALSGSIILGDATDTGALTINGAATLLGNTTIDVPTGSTIAHTLGGALTDGAGSFSLTKEGLSGILALNGANTYDGGTFINGGRVNASNAASFGSGPVTVADGGQAYLVGAGDRPNAFTIEGIGFSENAGNLGAIRLQGATISGPIALTYDARITAHGSTGTLAGDISEVGTPSSLELSNYNTSTDSTITVSGNNSYSLGTSVKGAIVVANHNHAFGTGPVIIESNGTAARTTRVQLGTNVTIDNDIIVSSNALTNFRGAVFSYAGDPSTPSLAVVNGDIEIQSATGNGGHFAAEASSQSVLRIMGKINVLNDVIPLVRVGTVELGGGGVTPSSTTARAFSNLRRTTASIRPQASVYRYQTHRHST